MEFNIVGLIIGALIGLVFGLLARRIMPSAPVDVLVDIILGIVGAVLGNLLVVLLIPAQPDVREYWTAGIPGIRAYLSILYSALMAIILLAARRCFTPRRAIESWQTGAHGG
ncbi:MAG TPA: hypothetical protein VHL09_10845 [Dehalococcoidia bacterium]|nr:hypothetical protein [Dehalococcoidia bacterium]